MILHASSGKPSTPTVFGKFHFYRKTPGYNSHGMYYSNYFIGGYAIHGYAAVPTYAGQPRLHPDPDPEREARLPLGQPRRHDLRLPLERRRRSRDVVDRDRHEPRRRARGLPVAPRAASPCGGSAR